MKPFFACIVCFGQLSLTETKESFMQRLPENRSTDNGGFPAE
jgi:hypothetical protein